MIIVDEVAFRRMDVRIAALLLDRSQAQNPVRITHREIASELGSSREVAIFDENELKLRAGL